MEQGTKQVAVRRDDGSRCPFGDPAGVTGQSHSALDGADPHRGMFGQLQLDGFPARCPTCVDVVLDRMQRVAHRLVEVAPPTSQLTAPESQE